MIDWMSKNPNWTRDEVILALHLYMSAERKQLDKTHPRVIELSNTLNRLPVHSREKRNALFRNPTGVSMKLGNIRAVDPEFEGAGLSRGSKLEAEVWAEFEDDPYRLAAVAESIVANIGVAEPESQYSADLEEEEFPEGKVLTRVHKARERNRAAVTKKKAYVLKRMGTLACEACGFDFREVYGDLGDGFAECHHTVPVSKLKEGQKTSFKDLSILCANCHRMIHRSRPMLSVSELKQKLEDHFP